MFKVTVSFIQFENEIPTLVRKEYYLTNEGCANEFACELRSQLAHANVMTAIHKIKTVEFSQAKEIALSLIREGC